MAVVEFPLHGSVEGKKKKKKKRKRAMKMEESNLGSLYETQEGGRYSKKLEHSMRKKDHEDEKVEQQGEPQSLRDANSEDTEKLKQKLVRCGIMSTESFASLGLSNPTLKAIHEMGFQQMTQVCNGVFLLIYGFNYL